MQPLHIGITCYPTVGGSGILASALGEELAARGHEVHFISYERPVRVPENVPRIHFHPVNVSSYGLFKYPDYTLPLSVKMAEVSRDCHLDILHVHYAVPHATAAILARSMLAPEHHPQIVTTLHGTDTTLLGDDPGYGPAIRHALNCSDAVTTVSTFLKTEVQKRIGFQGAIDVIHNFFPLRAPTRSRAAMRDALGIRDEVVLLHCSNLRRMKRIDLLLETVAQIRAAQPFKLVILAGGSFAPYAGLVERLGLSERVIVRENAGEVEDYLQAADVGLYTSESESFCLGILEGMWHGCPAAAMRVGGIPEVVEDGVTGRLVPFGEVEALAVVAGKLIDDPIRRSALGQAAQSTARKQFSAEVIVPQYEALYRRLVLKKANAAGQGLGPDAKIGGVTRG